MRTTLDIDEDLLLAVKELARRKSTTAGRVVSSLLRQALTEASTETPPCVAEPAPFYGFRPFPSRGGVVTNEAINKLRDEVGD